MTDREKVIRGLYQHCERSMFDRCGECPYYEVSDEPFWCRDALLIDVLTLLREQEPVKTEPVRFRVVKAGGGGYPFWDCVCDGCGFKTSTVHTNWRFCPECGRSVKWDD